MNSAHRSKLEQLGLSTTEAQIYLALLHHGPLPAATIAKETGIPRTGVYPNLACLADKGLVEGGLGHGSKFAAVDPEEALPSLIIREEHALAERKRVADELAETLAPLAADAESALDDTVQVVRTPQVISERFHRLQLEAEHEVLNFVKAPILMPSQGNPAEQKSLQRGVRYRCLYERAVLDDPKIGPYLKSWIAAGEEARLYSGELPYKLVLFDRKVVLLTLVRRSGESSALMVRHEPFAKSIAMLFDTLWKEALPVIPEPRLKTDAASRRSARKMTAGKIREDGADRRVRA
jgi:sugar-specific transcriptional regulator TrmB